MVTTAAGRRSGAPIRRIATAVRAAAQRPARCGMVAPATSRIAACLHISAPAMFTSASGLAVVATSANCGCSAIAAVIATAGTKPMKVSVPVQIPHSATSVASADSTRIAYNCASSESRPAARKNTAMPR
ncbi:hypothetical protein D3C83_08220 [compost metagenome]